MLCMINRVLIVYKSKHNTTKQYAEWIHEEVESDLINFDYLSIKDIEKYEIIVLGSWIFDDKVVIADFIINNWKMFENKKVIIFSNGLTHPKDGKLKEIFDSSFPQYIKNSIYFYALGGELSFNNLSLYDKLILKFKHKFREVHNVERDSIRPIVIKIYDLKVLGN